MARNCKGGLDYCGHTLLEIGNYRAQAIQALHNAGKPITDDWIKYTLFYCTGFDGGDIVYKKSCNQHCTNAGSGQNDHCG